jgi:hypothetical protein
MHPVACAAKFQRLAAYGTAPRQRAKAAHFFFCVTALSVKLAQAIDQEQDSGPGG